MKNFQNKIYKIVTLAVLASAVSAAPLFAQVAQSDPAEEGAEGVRFAMPMYTSYRTVFDQVTTPGVTTVSNTLRNIDFGISFQFLFPTGGALSIGPEFGFGVPLGWVGTDNYVNTAVFHIPIRIVLRGDANQFISWDAFFGIEYNISDLSYESLRYNEFTQEFEHTNVSLASTVEMTFDIGARVYFGGFMMMAAYKFPGAIVLNDTLRLPGLWENSVFFGIGYQVGWGWGR